MKAWIVGVGIVGEGVGQGRLPAGFVSGVDSVYLQFGERCFLNVIDKGQCSTLSAFRETMKCTLLIHGTSKEFVPDRILLFVFLREKMNRSIRCTGDFDMVPGFIGHHERCCFPGGRVTVPVGFDTVIGAAG